MFLKVLALLPDRRPRASESRHSSEQWACPAWRGNTRGVAPPPPSAPSTAADFVNLAVQIGVAFVAWVNWRRGRADVRSALRLGAYAGIIVAVSSLLLGHRASLEVGPWSIASYVFAFFSILYLAVEPWSRRMWAHAMVTWTRVLAGRFRDPLVGRDVLAVVACVTFDHALQRVIAWPAGWFLEPASGAPAQFGIGLETLLGGRMMAWALLTPFVTGIFTGMAWFAVLLVAKTVFKRTWLAAAFYFLFFGVVIGDNRIIDGNWPNATLWGLELLFLLVLSLRFGLFAASLFSTLSIVINRGMLTYDFGAWYGQGSLVATVVLVAFALYGFYAALGGRPIAAFIGEGATGNPERGRP